VHKHFTTCPALARLSAYSPTASFVPFRGQQRLGPRDCLEPKLNVYKREAVRETVSQTHNFISNAKG